MCGACDVRSAQTVLKTCTCCGLAKPHNAFLFSRLHADGCTDKCAKCIFDLAQAERDRREKAAAARKARAPSADHGKRCTCCGERKTLDEFAKHGRAKDGRRKTCRSCVAASGQNSLEDLAAAAVRRAMSRARRSPVQVGEM